MWLESVENLKKAQSSCFFCPQVTDVRAAARQVRGIEKQEPKRTVFSCSLRGAAMLSLQRLLTKVHKLERGSKEVRYRTKYVKPSLTGFHTGECFFFSGPIRMVRRSNTAIDSDQLSFSMLSLVKKTSFHVQRVS